MKSPPPPALIEIRLREIRQLFNSLDATPFPETDLDGEAEDFILGWARELPQYAPLHLRIHLQEPHPDAEHEARTRTAIQGFFLYRAENLRRQLRQLLARGRFSLLIGLTCLVLSVGSAQLVAQLWQGALVSILTESLVIGGWVAMWNPIQVFLYDWWPLRRQRRICERLAAAHVEFVTAGKFA